LFACLDPIDLREGCDDLFSLLKTGLERDSLSRVAQREVSRETQQRAVPF